MSTGSRPTMENRLLAALPADERNRLAPHLEPFPLHLKNTLHEVDEPIDYVYFPNTGVISLVSVMADGAIVEVATIGNEGMAGLPVFLGSASMSARAFPQIEGHAMRMRAEVFRECVDASSPLTGLLHRYTQALFNQIAQGAACNRAHPLEERCARWMLMTHDRVDGDEFLLTHEFLSQMLGTRRPSVTLAAGLLQKAGYIQYSRARVRILDREGLEAAACECYRVIRRGYDLLPS